MSRLERVSEHRLVEAPQQLRDMVAFLNEALKMDPQAVTQVVDFAARCSNLFVAHPSIVIRGSEGEPLLSALGLLAGFVNAQPFMLVANFKDKGQPGDVITEFFVGELQP